MSAAKYIQEAFELRNAILEQGDEDLMDDTDAQKDGETEERKAKALRNKDHEELLDYDELFLK